jgi:hypothetical protein
MMWKLNQSRSITFTGLIITIAYFTFLNQDLLSTTIILNSLCLDKPDRTTNLCVSCIHRSELGISDQSSIYIHDTQPFKVMQIPMEKLVDCEELLQLISYDVPM